MRSTETKQPLPSTSSELHCITFIADFEGTPIKYIFGSCSRALRHHLSDWLLQFLCFTNLISTLRWWPLFDPSKPALCFRSVRSVGAYLLLEDTGGSYPSLAIPVHDDVYELIRPYPPTSSLFLYPSYRPLSSNPPFLYFLTGLLPSTPKCRALTLVVRRRFFLCSFLLQVSLYLSAA